MSKVNSILTRLVFIAGLYIATFVLPWWAVAVLAAIGVLVFSWFFEAVALAFYIDVLFSAGWIPWLSLCVLGFLFVVEIVTYYVSHR